MKLYQYKMNIVKTTTIAMVLSIFAGNAWAETASGRVENGTAQTDLQQVFQHNEYIIEQLEKLVRAEKRKPYRTGSKLKNTDIMMLWFRASSINYLMERKIHPGSRYQPQLPQNSNFNTQTLLHKSHVMLKNLQYLFEKYPSVIDSEYDPYAVPGWFTPSATKEKLYQQFLHIESYLFALKKVVKPKGVYDVAMLTRDLLWDFCPRNNEVTQAPLVMGKRPEDVYALLFEYLEQLARHTEFSMPTRDQVNVHPQDVFDVAIISLVFSRAIQVKNTVVQSSNVQDIVYQPPRLKHSGVITPSHVYQAVSWNIKLLECSSNAD